MPLRLVVLPEYLLTSFPDRIGIAEFAAIDPGGPEYDALGQLVQATGVFLAANAYERDAYFPVWMTNTLARQRLELFAAAYAGSVQPADSLLDGGTVTVPKRDWFRRNQDAVIARLDAAGLI